MYLRPGTGLTEAVDPELIVLWKLPVSVRLIPPFFATLCGPYNKMSTIRLPIAD